MIKFRIKMNKVISIPDRFEIIILLKCLWIYCNVIALALTDSCQIMTFTFTLQYLYTTYLRRLLDCCIMSLSSSNTSSYISSSISSLSSFIYFHTFNFRKLLNFIKCTLSLQSTIFLNWFFIFILFYLRLFEIKVIRIFLIVSF
jgi:hypothetical protein